MCVRVCVCVCQIVCKCVSLMVEPNWRVNAKVVQRLMLKTHRFRQTARPEPYMVVLDLTHTPHALLIIELTVCTYICVCCVLCVCVGENVWVRLYTCVFFFYILLNFHIQNVIRLKTNQGTLHKISSCLMQPLCIHPVSRQHTTHPNSRRSNPAFGAVTTASERADLKRSSVLTCADTSGRAAARSPVKKDY